MSNINEARRRAQRASGDAWLDETVPMLRTLIAEEYADENLIAEHMLPPATRAVAMAAMLRLARTTGISTNSLLDELQAANDALSTARAAAGDDSVPGGLVDRMIDAARAVLEPTSAVIPISV